MHADQIPFDRALAERLVRAQFPLAGSVAVELLDTAATTNYVVRVGDGYSARFPMQAGDSEATRSTLLAERDALAEFAAASPVPSPLLVFIGTPDADYPMPWSVQSWIPGDVATPVSVASAPEFARDLAGLIIALRGVATRGRPFSGAGRGGALTDHDEWVAHCLTQSEGMLPVMHLRRLWEELRTTPRSGPDVMSHKDLTPFNLLVRDDRLAGVLDTGGFGPADPALDLVAAWHLFDVDGRAVLRESIAADDDEWHRGAAWALQQALGLVWYYAESNPAMSELGRSTLDRILTSPELHR